MKTFNILAIGDIVGPETVGYLKERLWKYRKENNIALTIVNAENACVGNGLDTVSADTLLTCGADVITSGNHIWRKRDIRRYLDETPAVLRPLNYPSDAPGNGYIKYSAEGKIFLVANVLGIIYLDPLECPFLSVERMLEKENGNYDYAVLDIHAEATSEKIALARYFDGKINIIFGTHTHVATADEQILTNGTGYISDIGMSGPVNSVLGIKTECIIEKLKGKLPVKFDIAEGEIEVSGALFTLDGDSGRTAAVQRIKI